MTPEKADTPKNGNKWTPVIVAVVGAFVGSAGTISVYLGTPIGQAVARPDPFTGAQAAIIERRVTELERHVRYHPDSVNQFDRRITVLETQNKQIIANQERILSRLNKP